MKKDSPCKNCVEKRHTACHSDCGEYLDWKAEIDAKRKSNLKDAECNAYEAKQRAKTKRMRYIDRNN